MVSRDPIVGGLKGRLSEQGVDLGVDQQGVGGLKGRLSEHASS